MIYFDMDGTIANLYKDEKWLEKLRAYDSTLYANAEVLVNMNSLAKAIHKAQNNGHQIGIISWLSRDTTAEYDREVIKAKRNWLKKHLRSVRFDDIQIVAYGTPKSSVAKHPLTDILFDDEQANREEWKGQAYAPEKIFEILRNIS